MHLAHGGFAAELHGKFTASAFRECVVWQEPCRFKSIIILDDFSKWMGFTQCWQTQYQYPAAHSQIAN